ncbi:MAG TPA: hypothetical protein VM223_02095, partial [Planctomycetota bacterium]|nr:hypothetical protein [Planctomycetota bacterium]
MKITEPAHIITRRRAAWHSFSPSIWRCIFLPFHPERFQGTSDLFGYVISAGIHDAIGSLPADVTQP